MCGGVITRDLSYDIYNILNGINLSYIHTCIHMQSKYVPYSRYVLCYKYVSCYMYNISTNILYVGATCYPTIACVHTHTHWHSGAWEHQVAGGLQAPG